VWLFAASSLALASGANAQSVENPDVPIIPDSQFEEALPSLDPALDAPLQSIDDFTLPDDPATAPETPPVDPALTEPLPPLATFDVTPPVEPSEPDDAAPASVRYSLSVEGLDEVDLEGRFRSLSALDDGDGRASNGAMIAARAREDEALAIRILRSEGYYDGVATAVIEQLPDQPGQLRVVLTAVPGNRYNFGEIVINGPEVVPPDLPRASLPLESGTPIVAAEVEGAEANVSLRLQEQGYPFAEIGRRDILLDPQTRLGDYTLPVAPGPRASFGGFTTEGDLAFDADHVGVLTRFERGELYDSRKVDDLREALVATNLFTTVSAEPVRTGEMAPDGTEYVNILVRQDAGPARSLSANAGYGTGEGLKIEGAWEHRNLFPPEGALRVGAIAGTQEQSASVLFRRSNAGQRDRTFLVSAEAGRRDYAAFTGYTARLATRMSRDSTPIWQKRWTWALGAEFIATNESRFDFDLLERPRETYFIGGLTGQLGYDTSDDLLNPTRGFRLLGRVNPEGSLRDGFTPYIRNQIDGSVYVPAGDSLVIAARARFGSIYGIARDRLAPSRRFYAGGGGSVRGFGYQELGPKAVEFNEDGDPLPQRAADDDDVAGGFFGQIGRDGLGHQKACPMEM